MNNGIVTIDRERCYNRRPMGGGAAWNRLYTVTVPGEPRPFVGTGVGWARYIAKRKGGGRRVVETWR